MKGIAEMENRENQLELLLQKLKTNEDKVGKELLQTKYKKPYAELKQEIKNVASEILRDISLKDIVVKNDASGQAWIESIKEVLERERKTGGVLKNASQALFIHKDVDKFKEECGKVKQLIQDQWTPYFMEHCCAYIADDEGYIYNDLTQKFYINDTWIHSEEITAKQGIIITAGACRLLTKKEEG